MVDVFSFNGRKASETVLKALRVGLTEQNKNVDVSFF